METDSKGNIFVDVGNVRISYIESQKRLMSKDWAETDVIRIQAYKGRDTKALHMGAEIPIEKTEKIIDLMEALIKIYKERIKNTHNNA